MHNQNCFICVRHADPRGPTHTVPFLIKYEPNLGELLEIYSPAPPIAATSSPFSDMLSLRAYDSSAPWKVGGNPVIGDFKELELQFILVDICRKCRLFTIFWALLLRFFLGVFFWRPSLFLSWVRLRNSLKRFHWNFVYRAAFINTLSKSWTGILATVSTKTCLALEDLITLWIATNWHLEFLCDSSEFH